MPTLPLAHLLHWYFLPLYAAPVLIVLGSAIAGAIRARQEARRDARARSGAQDAG